MGADTIPVDPWMILPFGVLLSLIALAPLLFPTWWRNHYSKVAYALAAITLIYYFVGLRTPNRVWHIAREYVSFITLIGSLYIVSGGIHINVKGEATPLANTIFLLIGAILANIFGTTGASVLMIRPWLRMNKHRIRAYHVIFFIFIVSNVGGCLTPIGDPPLFLGYLSGIPFWWVAGHCLPMWGTALGLLLLIFLAVDYRGWLRMPGTARKELTGHEQWRFEGVGNLLFLAIILISVFIRRPPLLREALMALAAFGSYFTTRKPVHDANEFNFHPLQEVAILFIGIFATMLPALDWLQMNAGRFENATSSSFYFGSGVVSSFLDNAPTYLCFLKVIIGRFVNHTGPDHIAITNLLSNPTSARYILAISIGSVFFGANTYIANGPNFMVRTIAEHQRVPTPSFFGFIFKFTIPIMAPVLLLVWLLFFRG